MGATGSGPSGPFPSSSAAAASARAAALEEEVELLRLKLAALTDMPLIRELLEGNTGRMREVFSFGTAYNAPKKDSMSGQGCIEGLSCRVYFWRIREALGGSKQSSQGGLASSYKRMVATLQWRGA
jgi:hypothetical protein